MRTNLRAVGSVKKDGKEPRYCSVSRLNSGIPFVAKEIVISSRVVALSNTACQVGSSIIQFGTRPAGIQLN
jgi:hypothetical protein